MDTPEYQARLKEARQKRKAALLRAGMPDEFEPLTIASAVQGVM